MVLFWVIINGFYTIFILNFVVNEVKYFNSPDHISFIEAISIYVCAIIIFKISFGILHTMKMKYLYFWHNELQIKIEKRKAIQDKEDAIMY